MLLDVLGDSLLAGAVYILRPVVCLVSALVQANLELPLVELHTSHEEFHAVFALLDTLLVLLEGSKR